MKRNLDGKDDTTLQGKSMEIYLFQKNGLIVKKFPLLGFIGLQSHLQKCSVKN